jgi:hypothetical protein
MALSSTVIRDRKQATQMTKKTYPSELRPVMKSKPDLRGKLPESWSCIDCGINTAPGLLNREQMEHAMAADWNDQGVDQTIDERSEVYTVKSAVWKAARMGPMAGCLCIGCLEQRLGRTLTPRDFLRNHPFNQAPGTERLLARRQEEWQPTIALF